MYFKVMSQDASNAYAQSSLAASSSEVVGERTWVARCPVHMHLCETPLCPRLRAHACPQIPAVVSSRLHVITVHANPHSAACSAVGWSAAGVAPPRGRSDVRGAVGEALLVFSLVLSHGFGNGWAANETPFVSP